MISYTPTFLNVNNQVLNKLIYLIIIIIIN